MAKSEEKTVETTEQKPAEASEAPKQEGAVEGASQEQTPPPAPKAKDHAAWLHEKNRIQKKNRQLSEQLAAKDTEFQSLAQKIEALTQAHEKTVAELEAAKQNPIQWAAKAGVDPEKAIRGFVDGETPEARIKRLEESLKAREEAEAAREADRVKKEQAAHIENLSRQAQAQMQGFVKEVTAPANAKKYPHLNAEWEPEEILAQTSKLMEWAGKQRYQDEDGAWRTGLRVSFDEAAITLEQVAKSVHDKRAERRKALLSPPVTESGADSQENEESGADDARPGNGDRVKEAPAKTVNGKKTNGKRALSKEEQEAADLAMLRAAFAKDRAANKSA